MGRIVGKFSLKTTDEQTVRMPRGAELLSLQVQHGAPCVWALIDPSAPQVGRVFHVVGTGHPADRIAGCRFVGTYQLDDGHFVAHVFVEPEPC